MFSISWRIDGSSILFGCEVSNVAIFAIAAILFLAIFAGTILLRKSRKINFMLEQGTAKLREFAFTSIDSDALKQLNQFFSSNEYFKTTWNEYRETLLETSGQVYSTAQAERFFNDDSLIDSTLLIPFYTAVPGLLTSIGLIGTFVSIYIALMQLPVTEGQITDITPFIHTLSGKFLASIGGLVGAFAFVLFEKRNIGKMKHRCREFQVELNGLFEAKPQEKLLDELNKNITKLVENIHEDKKDFRTMLSEVLTDTSKIPIDNLTTTTAKMLVVQESAYTRRDEVLSQLVVQIAHEFRQALTEAASEDIKQLAEAMASASILSSELRTNVDNSLTHLQGLVRAQKDQLDNLLSYQAEQCDQVVKNQKEQFQELTNAQEKRVAELLAQFTSSLDQQFKMVDKSCRMVAKNINEVTAAQNSQSEEIVSRFRDQIQVHSDISQRHLSELSEVHTKAASDSQQKILSTLEDSLAGLSESSKNSTKMQTEMLAKMTELSSTWVDKASNDLSVVLQNANDQSAKSTEVTSLLSQAIQSFNVALNESKNLNGQVTELSESLLRANQAVASSDIAMRRSNTETVSSVKLLQEQMHSYQSMLSAQQELWAQQKESLHALGSTIDNATSALKANAGTTRTIVAVGATAPLAFEIDSDSSGNGEN